RDDSHGDRRSSLRMDRVTVAGRPAPVREEVTSGRICDGPRPTRVGQSPDEVTEVGRTASAAPTGADNSTGRHRERANCFESHTPADTTDIHPDQPVPDQPNPDSQIASDGPLLVPGRSKIARMSAARCFIVRPSLRTSTSAAGTPVVIVAITACMASLAFFLSG